MNIDSFANSKFVKKISDFGSKLGSNKYIQGISRGIMMSLPIIIVGAIISMFSGLKIDSWQEFIGTTGIGNVMKLIVASTTNMLGVYFCYGIAKALAEQEKVKSKIVPLFAIITYIALLPYYQLEDGRSYFMFDYLGTNGMIVGILLAILTVKVFSWVEKRNLVIKMPSGTPDYVAQSFVALIPGFVQAFVIMLIAYLISLTEYSSIFDLLFTLIQTPIVGLVGGSILANAVIQILTQMSWAIGLHPGYIQSMMAPILMSLDGEKQAAYATGQEVTNIIGMSFNYITTTAVLFPAIAVAILIFAKSQRLRNIGKVSVAPAFFGISEPLIFGLPIVFNPLIWIPWLLAPVINFSIAYLLTSIGLVEKTAGVLVFNMPMVITGLLNGSFTISLLEIGLFILDIALFSPFIMILDKKYKQEEIAA